MTWGTPRQWRSIGGQPPRQRKVWIDTGSGPGLEIPSSEVHRFTAAPFPTGTLSGTLSETTERPDPAFSPDLTSDDVRADLLRRMIRRHTPTANRMCLCGAPLGQETGLCRRARLALDQLMRMTSDEESPKSEEERQEIEAHPPPMGEL